MIFTHQERGRGFWIFNNSLLSDPAYVKLVKDCINETVDEYKINGDMEHPESLTFSINDQPLFETLKLQIRGKTISYAAWKKKEQNKTENFLQNEINSLQQSLNVSPCEETQRKLTQKQNELQGLREHKMCGISIRSKANWITRGEKSTKYFLNLEKRHYTNKLIPKLVLEDAIPKSQTKKIKLGSRSVFMKSFIPPEKLNSRQSILPPFSIKIV